MIATAADGTRVHYIVEGAGPPLVLVGGKTSSIEGAWWRYIPPLAQRLKVIALDNRGAGASDKPDTPYSTQLMAEDALSVLHDGRRTAAASGSRPPRPEIPLRARCAGSRISTTPPSSPTTPTGS
jgi:hypothetical protein